MIEAVIDHTAEYHEALAANIVQELLHRQRKEGGQSLDVPGTKQQTETGGQKHKTQASSVTRNITKVGLQLMANIQY